MSADPPWLSKAAKAAKDAWINAPGSDWSAVVRAVLAFAARQPRPITEATVKAAKAHTDG